MGVCRGRISEGLDFSDNAARCVIVIGIPYPQMTDPKVILKKDYLDRRFRTGCSAISRPPDQQQQCLSGKDWYSQQATRAVNQAIGRVIRHVQDYGSIILVDERYTWQTNRREISKWLRDRVRVWQSTDDLTSVLLSFFEEMKGRNFVPKVEQLAQVHLEIDEEEDQVRRQKSKKNGEAAPRRSKIGKITQA